MPTIIAKNYFKFNIFQVKTNCILICRKFKCYLKVDVYAKKLVSAIYVKLIYYIENYNIVHSCLIHLHKKTVNKVVILFNSNLGSYELELKDII